MAYEQRENSGSMFVNDKQGNESWPDRQGSAMVGGVLYWVKGWIKAGKEGKPPWMSMSFTRQDAPMAQHSTPPAAAQPADDKFPF